MDPSRRPHRLRSLTIENLRGIDHLTLEFPETDPQEGGVLVMAGANGCGKTTVLEAALMALGRVDLLPRDLAAPQDLVRFGASDFSITAEWWPPIESPVPLDSRRLSDVMTAFARETATPQGVMKSALAFEEQGLTTPRYAQCRVEYVSARREPEGLGESVGLVELRARRSTREERRLAELQRRLVNAHPRQGSERIFERINHFYSAFVGGEWRIDVLYKSNELGAPPVVVACDGDLPESALGPINTLDTLRARAQRGEPTPRVIPVDRLSSGQMALLAMSLPFLFGEVDLCLIDEPEQHLHPTWQRAFLPALRALSPATQFLVATHSPMVLDSVYSFERVLLSDDLDVTPDRRPGAAA